ncbi:MAG: amino acid ABC transporter permease [Proteobacteria bacterium]|nr:amino acid ABC transporter permease [Pseudomonadota bacterium]MCH9758392.1 amino acid ABC transporter permease [Pseudomonadota bacterium]
MNNTFTPLPSRTPPGNTIGFVGWLRQNLFSSWGSSLFTIFGIYLLLQFIPPAVQWFFLDATWGGSDRSGCETEINGETADAPGACWTFIRVRAAQMFFGLYFASHADQIWRPILMFVLFFAMLIPLLLPMVARKIKNAIGLVLIFIFPIVAYSLLDGSWLGMPVAHSSEWGGFLLTFILASVGIVAAFPISVVMALGRRSEMPIIRSICVFYIEIWRAAPLITILFMASNLLPLFFPSGVNYDKVARALIAITLFQSAYMAEAIRGGLQAIPKGQFEGADSLGLGYWQKTIFIVLPQALKISIPGLVNSALQLFKDTALVGIIGLHDFLEITKVASRSPEWIGYDFEGLIFVSIFYFIFCYAMSKYSQGLERKLDTGHKT